MRRFHGRRATEATGLRPLRHPVANGHGGPAIKAAEHVVQAAEHGHGRFSRIHAGRPIVHAGQR